VSHTDVRAGATAPAAQLLPVAQIIAPGGLLALDLSSTCGYAVGPLAARVPTLTGTWHLPHTGGEGARYTALANELAEALMLWRPSRLVLEAPLPLPAQTTFRSAAQQFGLRAIAYSEGYRASCVVSEIDCLTVRAEVMGQRRISKDIAKREAVLFCKRRGIGVNSHHAADAALVWLWLRERLAGVAPCAGPLWRETLQ
jgi:hypothetical protein